jgi:5-methylcytosine-specific restriction protein B
MDIKAISTVLENPGDGHILKEDWEPVEPSREWYFFTYDKGVWSILREGWMTGGLINFAFEPIFHTLENANDE